MLSRWWESIHPIFNHKPGVLLQPGEDQIEQLLHGLTAMTAGEFFVQRPPHPLNRICLRRVSGEVMEHQPMAPAAQIALHGLTVMAAGIVTNEMDLPVTPQAAAQVVELADEQSRGAALCGAPGSHPQRSGPPVKRARQLAFLVGAGGGNLSLVAAAHPHGPDFGIGVDSDLVLEQRALAGRQRGQELAQGVQFGLSLGGQWDRLPDAAGATPVVLDATSAARVRH